MTRRRSVAVPLVLLAAMIMVVVGTATSAAAAPVSWTNNPAVIPALKRIAANAYSDQDVKLIKQYPELAGKIMDPRSVKVTVEYSPNLLPALNPGGITNATDVGIAAETCGFIEHGIIAYTYLGDIFFRWHHHAGACRDGRNITRWAERYDIIRDADKTLSVEEITANAAGPVPADRASSYFQRKIQQCVIPKIGCIFNYYPWANITLFGHGQNAGLEAGMNGGGWV